MRSNRVLTALAACVASATVLAGCASEEEIRLGEPELDFPYTSTTPTPTFELDLEDLLDEDEEDLNEDEEDTEDTETETSEDEDDDSSETSSERTITRTSTHVSTREITEQSTRRQEPEPGAACAWPNEAEANGREFATYCNREWARTVLDGQQYFWVAKGSGWVSVDPTGERDNQACWNRDSFNGAPEAIRNAVVYCQ
ncbi:hypothetical protein JZY91_08455 [Corynebacterium sp. CNCTC7651]|uniref:hypothetical protein n=1 Tax=Corynebacterium sp. CNCTC7651 TaxID=2815361 RepID=UPI001F1CCA49|nr:hypothetical protein [Corynebacterium sp. CNCTC7651]UIZ91754.1 hypothetical protein JZY91_08455 [Corynebacterium sp. CNCTC7651]